MKKLIIVADWASDSLTCQEVRSVVEGFLKDHDCGNITFIYSTPSTIHTAFLISQLSEVEERYGKPLETVIFQNTDPRLQTDPGQPGRHPGQGGNARARQENRPERPAAIPFIPGHAAVRAPDPDRHRLRQGLRRAPGRRGRATV